MEAERSTQSTTSCRTSPTEPLSSGGIFDFDGKQARLKEVSRRSRIRTSGTMPSAPRIWAASASRWKSVVLTLQQTRPGSCGHAGALRSRARRGRRGGPADIWQATSRPSKRGCRASSSVGCSRTRWTRTTASSTFRPVPAAPRHRTGPPCSSACTSSSVSAGATP